LLLIYAVGHTLRGWTTSRRLADPSNAPWPDVPDDGDPSLHLQAKGRAAFGITGATDVAAKQQLVRMHA
jgi:hypothetical protein